MTSSVATYANPAASPQARSGKVAFAPSSTCRSCHDAGGTDQGAGIHADSFPHSTPGYFRFMHSAGSIADSSHENTAGMQDGLCLKCHRSSETTGVGLTY